MKKYISIVLILLAIFINKNYIYADENVDINQWAYGMLTKGSDQDENVIVSKYYNINDYDQIAFCIEPNVKFNAKSSYTKKLYDNKNIYNIVKAYNSINSKDKNYFIAAQILIWKEVTGVEYTFGGNDYLKYKSEILNIIDPIKPLLKSSSTQDFIDCYVGEENVINEDFSEFNIETNGIEVISNDENGLKYIVKNNDPEIKTINFIPKDSDENHSYVMKSDDSQDIYYFEGEYSNLKPFSLNIRSLMLNKTIDINFSKKDENGMNIEGAEFTLYEINEEDADDEIIFINVNTPINIYECLLQGYTKYENLSIELSERYAKYLNNDVFNSSEIGYFSYKIYKNEAILKQGKAYITDDITLSKGYFDKIAVKCILSQFSKDLDINSINDLPNNKSYYLCESEPKKGYTYASNPCILIDSLNYGGKTLEFINKSRTYTLRLMKQSDSSILLNGAVFKINYLENEFEKSFLLTTGSLCINRENNNKYLVYKYENDSNVNIIEFIDKNYTKDGLKPGKYFYYQTNNQIIDEELLNDKYALVVDGGFTIDDIPYSSELTIEELIAPKGYVITDPIYKVSADIPYSEITFKNYRVNFLDIVVKKKFKIPKTCIIV